MATTSTRARRASERRVQFYRAGVDDESVAQRPLLRPEDIRSALERRSFSLSDTENRYLEISPDESLVCWVDGEREISFAKCRRGALPLVEHEGKRTGLSLSPDAAIAEITHVRFFSDDIVGVVYNHYGPRITALPHYLRRKSPAATPGGLRFEPLVRRDVIQEFVRMRRVKWVSMTVRASEVDRIREADRSLHRALKIVENESGATEISLQVTVGRGVGESIDERLRGSIQDLANDTELLHTIFKTLRAKGYRAGDSSASELDLLSDALIAKKSILRQSDRHRTLDAADAFRAIGDAYEELGEELASAPAVGT